MEVPFESTPFRTTGVVEVPDVRPQKQACCAANRGMRTPILRGFGPRSAKGKLLQIVLTGESVLSRILAVRTAHPLPSRLSGARADAVRCQ
jgi:hypothetical protein